MSVPIQALPVPLFEDEQGGLRVAGTRVLLERIVHAFENGATPEGIVQNYDTLQLADVYAVLSWYLRHKGQVQDYLSKRAGEAETIRRMIEAKQPDRTELRARLMARRAQKEAVHAPPLTDENFSGDIVRGLLRRHPGLDLVRVQDVGLIQTPDADILDWAAGQGSVLLSHDVSSVPPAAYQRVAEAKARPGVFIVPDRMAIGRAIDEILFLYEASEPEEWQNQVIYLPL